MPQIGHRVTVLPFGVLFCVDMTKGHDQRRLAELTMGLAGGSRHSHGQNDRESAQCIGRHGPPSHCGCR